jgi:hypothetical protein
MAAITAKVTKQRVVASLRPVFNCLSMSAP